MVVQESERVLGTARNHYCIKEVPLRVLIVCVDCKIALCAEVLVEMLTADEE